MVLMCIVFGISIASAFTWQYTAPSYAFAMLVTYVVPIVPLVGTVIFGAFGIWFGVCTYRVRRHPEARSRFLRLTFFSLLTAGTFVASSTMKLAILTQSIPANAITVQQFAALDIATLTVYAIRALICLAVTGLRWPTQKPREPVRASLISKPIVLAPVEESPSWGGNVWDRIASAFKHSRSTLSAGPLQTPMSREARNMQLTVTSMCTETTRASHPHAVQFEEVSIHSISSHHSETDDIVVANSANVMRST
ncbi:hypothetical protein THASP1DRAFT_33759 [Thamnocephalis sphaerospora]|uniref:DUF4203 domain-containing protein n=1 Tax=Thamnocephalis sphaerospora TaxID=78915 RepID=A0A4P9XGU2_9FUNG|nr:hypothetical protein THASP1DRAFT_33759 [Thamnocephalis sphaerospora]|eukprot:RKP04471.1 hypothetical protein THASP1DRAFT_33759 [Thamnocephalis sphaerospora]